MYTTVHTPHRKHRSHPLVRKRGLEPVLPRVALGDPRAVAECLERYSGLIWSIARKLCPNREEVDDAVQEVIVEIWKKADRFDNAIASELTFVALLTRRRLIDRRRRARPTVFTESIEDDSLPPMVDHDQELVDVEDEAEQAARVLARLRPDEQRVLKLSIFEGLSHDQIARVTTLPLGTVKTHLRRGLARVRELLAVDSPS